MMLGPMLSSTGVNAGVRELDRRYNVGRSEVGWWAMIHLRVLVMMFTRRIRDRV